MWLLWINIPIGLLAGAMAILVLRASKNGDMNTKPCGWLLAAWFGELAWQHTMLPFMVVRLSLWQSDVAFTHIALGVMGFIAIVPMLAPLTHPDVRVHIPYTRLAQTGALHCLLLLVALPWTGIGWHGQVATAFWIAVWLAGALRLLVAFFVIRRMQRLHYIDRFFVQHTKNV